MRRSYHERRGGQQLVSRVSSYSSWPLSPGLLCLKLQLSIHASGTVRPLCVCVCVCVCAGPDSAPCCISTFARCAESAAPVAMLQPAEQGTCVVQLLIAFGAVQVAGSRMCRLPFLLRDEVELRQTDRHI